MPFIRPLTVILCALLPAACTSYLERSDTIVSYAGEAQATNRAIHTIDPWPRAASDTVIAHDGQRIARAVERYRAREDKDAGAAAVSPSTASSAPTGATP